MAQMMRCKFGLFSLKYINNPLSRIVKYDKYQRSCFHTSWLLNVKGKEIFMPSLSPTMETGTIVKWMKKEGETIQPGDALADIQTDKAVMTFEMDDEAVLAKILIPEGSKDIKVGELIALIVEPDEDWKTVELPSSSSTTSSTSAPSTASPVEAAEPPAGQINVAMPALSPTMASGTIVKWNKKVGDTIEPGDSLADIQTDKAVMTFEMDEDAILAKILVEEGSEVTVGQIIAITVEKGMDIASIVMPSLTSPAAPSQIDTPVSSPSPSAKTSTPSTSSASTVPPSGQIYGLAVKRLLEEYGLSSGSIKGTGRPNRLLKSDVLEHIQSKNIQKVPPQTASATAAVPTSVPSTPSATSGLRRGPPKSGPSTYKDIEVSNIRAVIAKRLGESKRGIPHSYATVDIKLDALNEIREQLKADNIKLSVNDFVTKAVAHALLQCPDVNSLYKDGQVVRMQNVDVSVAVSTPSGLITPIVFDALSKSLSDISNDIKTLAGKARTGGLKPNEFQGGTFTISNLGMFGIKEFSAIINPPQTAILAVGTGRDVLDTTFKKSSVMSATLSYDRRAIDEDQAADFLSVLRSILEDPTILTISRGQQALRHRRN